MKRAAAPVLWQCLGAEFLGTLLLTFVALSPAVVKAASGVDPGYLAKVIAPGLLVMAVIYTFGEVSGAHINPAVTLGFWLRRDFQGSMLPLYWAAQLLGAVGGALILIHIFPGVPAQEFHHHFMTGEGGALIFEVILSFVLVSVILGTTNESNIGHSAAIPVGATIALCGLIGDPVSGSSMNPARSLGPMIASGSFEYAWIYVVGPFAGAILAVVVAWLLHGPPKPSERKAGQGRAKEAA